MKQFWDLYLIVVIVHARCLTVIPPRGLHVKILSGLILSGRVTLVAR